jgi:topoisomerase-4 subunit A
VEKGQIKIKKIDDNTAAQVEIALELAPGISPDVTIDALFAFTSCETSISPNACVIIDNKPLFTNVEELLRISTDNTRNLLREELEIKKGELEEKWLFASLEKIFIENRIYHEIEECESWEEVVATIYMELRKYVSTPKDYHGKTDKRLQLFRELNDDDIVRLTEIKIKRISKYNSFKADELIESLIEELENTEHHLAHLTEFCISYFKMLLDKFGKGKERKTIITNFDSIKATQVVANNAKLYVDRKEGFIGSGLKKDEFVCDCSDIDEIIVFKRDGKFQVSKIADKVFVGKDIIHVDVWKKGDDRTTYNLIYLDGKSGRSLAKRFNVTAITRDKDYDLTQGNPNSRVLYFSANPNGEAELVTITLNPNCSARIKVFDYGFADLEIKGRSSQGNIVTKYPVKKVTLKELGQSTIGAIKIWMDEVSGRLNADERGKYLGAFDTGDQILCIYSDGTYEMTDFELTRRFEVKDILYISKFDPETVVNAVYFDGNKEWTMIKRFRIETTTIDQRFSFLSDHKNSRLLFASVKENPRIQYTIKMKTKKLDGEVSIADFIEVKGWKALGNKLSDQKLLDVKEIEADDKLPKKESPSQTDDKYHLGDSIDFDIDANGQGRLF